ncbi:MAG TPA: T9SS type A sorting domain-containing protein, partial [Bacteroidales bacterium]|nr:T9SS type A sorting domain-containing protein [Bacteroidales bacterium]
DREEMTANTLSYLEANGRPGNYLFMGDFNLYESAEPAFQSMLNNNDPVFRFYDPVDQVGDWHANSDYREVHTQSTHTDSDGCHASGGMDDRFDFILMNEVLNGKADKVYYLDGSYHALGQDGLRLDGSLIDPPNTILPAYVIDALYNMSDHLPVIMDIVVDESLGLADHYQTTGLKVFYRNPAEDILTIHVQSKQALRVSISLVSVSGSRVYQEHTRLHYMDTISIPLNGLAPGMYFLHMKAGKETLVRKVIKK